MYIDSNDKKAIEKDIIYGMAKGPWANDWATKQEEKGQSFSGIDIYEVAPHPPQWAIKWAKKVSGVIVKLNEKKIGILPKFGKTSIADIANAMLYVFPEEERPSYEEIGFYLGCQVVGMGISWTDNLKIKPPFSLKLPHIQFYQS